MPSKDCDIVAEVSKCGSRGLDLTFPVIYLSNTFTAVRAGTSTSGVCVCFFRVREAKNKHMVPYHNVT